MSDSPIYLKKGVQIAHVMAASPVHLAELSPEMEAILGAETQQEPMLVSAWQEKLLEKFNLDGLSNWTSRNLAVTRELVLACHDIFALENNDLGCTSMIEHEICINDCKSFKERFRHLPPHFWRRCMPCSGIC